MRGCFEDDIPPTSHHKAAQAMVSAWSEKYSVAVDPELLSPRCKNWKCSRPEHWARKRRKTKDRPNDIERRQMMVLVANGVAQSQVAHIFGVTQQAVSRAWQSFVPNYRGPHVIGGDRKGKKFSKKIEAARKRAMGKMFNRQAAT